MKRLLIACLLGSFAFAAAAQDAASTAANAEANADADAQAQARSDAQAANPLATSAEQRAAQDPKAAVERDAKRDCIRYTGTHVKTEDLDSEDCVIAAGSVYSREDLLRTGRTDLADALRALDPSLR